MSKGELPGSARLLARVTDPEETVPSAVYALPDIATLRTIESLWPTTVAHTYDYTEKRAAARLPVTFGNPPESAAGPIVVMLPKGKELTRWLFAQLAQKAAPGCSLRLVGSKDEGIGSAEKFAGEGWRYVDTVAYGNHARIEAFERTDEPAPAMENFRTLQAQVEAIGGPVSLEVSTAPGVFAADGLDEGSRLLLRHLPALQATSALDLGCGAGWLARFLLQTGRAAKVEAVDTHWMALEATRATLASFGAAATVRASEGLSDATGGYDLVVSNPPFHQGHTQTVDPTLRMIADLPRVMRYVGRLYLVANRFLPYNETLDAAFERVSVVAETGKFRLYRAEAPRAVAPKAGPLRVAPAKTEPPKTAPAKPEQRRDRARKR
jgi:16S rRNA (guanine1207-N2)-methyltransferase